MSWLYEKFAQINTLSELQSLMGKTSDGETALIELKSVQEEMKNSNIGETKALLAKEICAFLNSNEGILVWGAGIDKETGLPIIANKSSENLATKFDNMLPRLIEPMPTSIETRMVHTEDGDCLLIFVPHGDLAPYRVGDWECSDKKRVLGRYFARSGTNSIRLPEAVVRSMYLANGRIPRIECAINVKILDNHTVSLNTIIQPDRFAFIKDYYCEREIVLLGNSLEMINIYNASHSDAQWESMDGLFEKSIKESIYPKESAYIVASNKITTHDEKINEVAFLSGLHGDEAEAKDGDAPFRRMFHNLYAQPDIFKKIFAIATKTTFACQNIPAKTITKLFILGSIGLRTEIAELDESQFSRSETMAPLEQRYGTEIYIPSTYTGALIVDDIKDDAMHMEPDDIRIKLSHIDKALNRLTQDKNSFITTQYPRREKRNE